MRTQIRFWHGAFLALRYKRVWALLYGFYLLLALVVVAPLAGFIANKWGRSQYSAALVSDFDVMGVMEVILQSDQFPFQVQTFGFALAVALALLAAIFYYGGVVELAVNGGEYSLPRFYGSCGKYFWRFVRLALIGAFFYGGVMTVNVLLTKGAQKLWGEGMVEKPIDIASMVRIGFIALLAGFVATVFDYARVRLVRDEARSSFKACYRSFVFVLSNLATTMGAWLALTVFGIVAFLVYNKADKMTLEYHMRGILIVLVLQQLYILARLALRMASSGVAAEIDGALRPVELPPAPEPAREVAVVLDEYSGENI